MMVTFGDPQSFFYALDDLVHAWSLLMTDYADETLVYCVRVFVSIRNDAPAGFILTLADNPSAATIKKRLIALSR